MRDRFIAVSVAMRWHAVVGHDVPPPPPADKSRHALAPMLAFQDLIAEAAWRRRDVRDKDRVLILERSQFRAGRAYWGKRWNWTEKSVRTFFKKLVTAGIIEISGQSEGHYANVATLCNYDKYQSPTEVAGQWLGQSRASDGPVTGQNLTKITKTTKEDGSFDRMWEAYPRKVAKSAARKAWLKLSAEDRERAIAAISAFSAKIRAERTEEKYIPHAASWLNGRRFEDFTVDPSPDVDDEEHLRRLAHHYLRSDDWDFALGPKPGLPGSVVTKELLAEARASILGGRPSNKHPMTIGGEHAAAA